MKHTSSSLPAKPDTATPSIAEWQETNNYWPESQCQVDLLIQPLTGRLSCEESCCRFPKYTFLRFGYKVVSLNGSWWRRLQFHRDSRVFPNSGFLLFVCDQWKHVHQWKRNCVQTYSDIYSFMKLRVFSNNNTKTFTLLILWGHSAAVFSGFLFKDFYLQVY